LPDGDYPARLIRFTGLGTQDQPPYKGQAKDPAFKASFTFELIGVDTSGQIIENATTDDEKITQMDAKPACQFADYFLFPGAKRGKVFELCNVLSPGIIKVPDKMEWFQGQLNAIVSVTVSSYTVKNGPNAGKKRNTIRSISSIPSMFKSQVGERRCELAYFDPYEDTPAMFTAYESMYKFQRDILTEAHDSKHIVFAGKEVVYQIAGDDQTAPKNITSSEQSVAEPAKEDIDKFAEDDVPF
jgi:hypothetical protein